MSDPRRVSEDLLIQLIREGRHDAEIGVRLGVSAGEVRERKRALRQRLGEQRYAEVLNAAEKTWTPPWKRRWVLVAVSVVAVVGLLLVVANLIVPEDEPIAAMRTVPTATPEPTARAGQVFSHEGVRFDDAGQFVTIVDGNGVDLVGSPDNRAGFAVFQLEGTGYIVPSDSARWEVAGGGRGELRLRAPSLNGRAVTLRLSAGHAATRVRSIRTDIGAIAEVYTQVSVISPVLLIRAYDDLGNQLLARMSIDGHLQISQTPVPQDWVIEPTTGRKLETGDAANPGRIRIRAGVLAATTCDRGSGGPESDLLRCAVVLENSTGVEMAVGGPTTCPSITVERLETPEFWMELSRGYTMTPATTVECRPRTVQPGDVILPLHEWRFSATTPDGAPLSVGVARDGTLHVGTFTGSLECPCLSQPN